MKGGQRGLLPFAAAACFLLAAGCQSTDEPGGSPDTASIPWDRVPSAQSGAGALSPQVPRSPLAPTADSTIPVPTVPTTTPGPSEVPTSANGPTTVTPTLAGVTASGVHIERHDGFDRIVYVFGGTYAPLWRAEYVAEATERGKQTSRRINGRSILQVSFLDTVSSAESGIAAYSGPNPLAEPTAHSVVEVYLTPSYERATQSFVGLRTEYPRFRVTPLPDPARIAVDIFD